MPISDAWFTSFKVEVRRYESTVSNYSESGDYETLYAELPTSIHGEQSMSEPTAIGTFGLGASQLIWRAQDIDGEKGWPREEDVVVYDGKSYFINRMADHTAIPPFFQAVKPHKVAFVGEELV